MEYHDKGVLTGTGTRTILAALTLQLEALDRIGAHVAAAHCDAAIQHLRLNLDDRRARCGTRAEAEAAFDQVAAQA